jgi:hypothetical protein
MVPQPCDLSMVSVATLGFQFRRLWNTRELDIPVLRLDPKCAGARRNNSASLCFWSFGVYTVLAATG